MSVYPTDPRERAERRRRTRARLMADADLAAHAIHASEPCGAAYAARHGECTAGAAECLCRCHDEEETTHG